MSQLKTYEKVVFEKLFDRGGFVLSFTDKTFSEFFREHGVDIDNEKYRFNGSSKMKRLRAFWETEQDALVAGVLDALLEYACVTETVDESEKNKALAILNRLSGQRTSEPKSASNEQDFLAQEYSQTIDLARLEMDAAFQGVIEQRISEIHKSLNADAALAVIFLCGSTLEGLLLDAATKNNQSFNRATSAPKGRSGEVRPFHEWTLDSLINTAHEVGLLSLDIKKHSHSLKDFRNYIHPRQQAVQNFKPDSHTAKICWQVLQAAVANLGGQRK
ncbi:MAG: hypothetical protein Q8K05_06645 [Polaromonas sp.]|uniref:hypothetical protein n=1 Tax=Polaromonas sp. TaxID=1869339 RepID=UPI0027310CAA|nr:hypothetical protein [Polaromonas sp.]MDP2255723.1 hypothetical protein [Polaromonas sp.]MDP3708486.1 hypothetical protein [Polaromonas sp.]